MVSAWACEQKLVLGQRKVDDKTNEITAIPELLALLELQGAIVTIDAMGCQRNICRKIQDAGADYVIGLKRNQGSLHEDVALFFDEHEARGNHRIRTGNAAANFATIEHAASNLLRRAPGKKSLPMKRHSAAWDDDYLEKVIMA